MKRITPFLWSIAIVLALGLGIYAGAKVTAAYKDAEMMKVMAQLDHAKEELSFWQATLRRVVEGDQVTAAVNGRVSKED
jgi:uncharacterized protein HemX